MDAQERLRMALRTVGCSRCGEPYLPEGVRILAQRETIAFVRLECGACSTEILALVTGAPTGDEGVGQTRWTAMDRPLDGADAALPGSPAAPEPAAFRVEPAPIDVDDVEAMRRFLDGYHGDIRSLLEGGRTEDR